MSVLPGNTATCGPFKGVGTVTYGTVDSSLERKRLPEPVFENLDEDGAHGTVGAVILPVADELVVATFGMEVR